MFFKNIPFQYIGIIPHALLIMWLTLLPLENESMFLSLVTVPTNEDGRSDAMCLLTWGNKRIQPPFLFSVSFWFSVSVFLYLSGSVILSLSEDTCHSLEASHHVMSKLRSYGELCVATVVNGPAKVSAFVNCKTDTWGTIFMLTRATFFKFQLRPQTSWNRDGLTSLCPVRLSDSQKLWQITNDNCITWGINNTLVKLY